MTYRAAIIGHTGNGNYGHGLDVVYRDISNVEVVAVADADEEGLGDAGTRTGASNLYTDYREMLEKESVDLVNVCPRVVTHHARMVIAAAEAGVRGLFCEKPLAGCLADADRMIAATAAFTWWWSASIIWHLVQNVEFSTTYIVINHNV